MSEDAGASRDGGRTDHDDGADAVEAYETGESVVLYDARNPLAWIESSEAVRIDETA